MQPTDSVVLTEDIGTTSWAFAPMELKMIGARSSGMEDPIARPASIQT